MHPLATYFIKNKGENRSLIGWFLLAVLFRSVRAYTHVSWSHPDEWFQTIELAHILSHGVGTWTHEIDLHLRNLSSPIFLAGLLKLAQWFFPSSLRARLVICQLGVGLFDLGMLWGWSKLARNELHQRNLKSPVWIHLAMALVVLPWFLVGDSVNLSGEHLSTIASWLMLGCLASQYWELAGIAAAGAFAFRYPTGLLCLGACIAIFVQYRFQQVSRRLVFGLILGTILFAIPDALFYHRPWESLWMYLHYNVLSGLSSAVYGSQNAFKYFQFFQYRWMTALIPLFGPLFILSGFGLFQSLKSPKKWQPWSLALALYLLGHVLSHHKEPRFMAPAESLVIWAGFVGILELLAIRPQWTRNLILVVKFSFLLNTLLIFGILWGDTWKMDDQYFALSDLIKKKSQKITDTCGVLTVKRHASFLYPNEALTDPPSISMGFLDMDRKDERLIGGATQATLIWQQRLPQCNSHQTLMLQVFKPNDEWMKAGCQPLPAGPFRLLSPSLQQALGKYGLISGPWYRCPPQILSKLSVPLFENPLVRSFPPIQRLPSLQQNNVDLLRSLIFNDSHYETCHWLCPAGTHE